MSEELLPDQDLTYCDTLSEPYIGELNCSYPKPFTCHYARELNKTLDVVSM